MRFKKFRAPKGQTLFVDSTLGHMVILNDDYSIVPEVLWSRAYSLGAISEDVRETDLDWVESKKQELDNKKAEENEKIEAVLKEIWEEPGNKLSKFGYPKLPEVTVMLGWKPEQSQVQEIWDKIKESKIG